MGAVFRPSKYAHAQETGPPGELKTPFAVAKDLDEMKDMVVDAKPEQVFNVADSWQAVYDHLVGGGGSVKGDFDSAVEHVLQHWKGDAADRFAEKAGQLSKKIADCAEYARYTSIAMRNAGEQLNKVKPKIDGLGKKERLTGPTNGLSGGADREGVTWRDVLLGDDGAKTAQEEDDDTPAGRERQRLRAAALMESLAITYSAQTQTMATWRQPRRTGNEGLDDYPGHPGGVPPTPGAGMFDGGGGRAAAAGAASGYGGAGKDALRAGQGAPTSAQQRAPQQGTTGGAETSAGAMRRDGISGGIPAGPRPGVPGPEASSTSLSSTGVPGTSLSSTGGAGTYGAAASAPSAGSPGASGATGPAPGGSSSGPVSTPAAGGAVPGGPGFATARTAGHRGVANRSAGPGGGSEEAGGARHFRRAEQGGGGGGFGQGADVAGRGAPAGIGAEPGRRFPSGKGEGTNGAGGGQPLPPQPSPSQAAFGAPQFDAGPAAQSGSSLHSSRGAARADDQSRHPSGPLDGRPAGGPYRSTKYDRRHDDVPDYTAGDEG